MQELIRQTRNKEGNIESFNEEDILNFYVNRIQFKNIREIIADMSINRDEKINSAESPPSRQKTNRKKAMSTIISDQKQVSIGLRGYDQNNYNTIYELSNEEYSRGGYSSNKKIFVPSNSNSKMKLPDDQ